MDFFSSPFLEIVALLALLILHALFKPLGHYPKTSTKKKSNNLTIPEPLGSLPLIGHLHLLGGQEPVARILATMADKHGPIYSLKLGQQRVLVLSSWELAKECLTTKDTIFATRPNIAIGKHVLYDSAAFAMAPYGQYWREIRKIATLHLLSSHRVQLLSHVRAAELHSFVKELFQISTEKVSGAVHLSELLEKFTFNLNLRLIAGKRLSSNTWRAGSEDTDAWRFKKAIEEALYLSGVFVWSDAIPWLEWLGVDGHVRSMKRVWKELDLVLVKWLEEHRRARSECDSSRDFTGEKDLMDMMLASLEEDHAILSRHSRDTAIKATALILTLTGAESTAITLTWAISLLLNNPTILKAVQEELDLHVGRNRWVEESDITNLKYLQAVLKEIFRLYPPGPITGLREATQDCHVAGFPVPKGTRLIVNIWKLHRDPRIWSDPLEFRPERFMTTHSDLGFRGENLEYIPFSSGRRGCPGISLGLAVVQFVLARLVQGFDMKTKDGLRVDMREGLGIALPKLTELEVVLAPRLPLELYK